MNLQKRLKSLCVVGALLGLLASCTTGTTELYLVRHAEKDTTIADNPPLTSEGEARAQRLAELLANEPIQYVFSTPTRRTEATVAPLASAKNLTIRPYSSDTLWEVARHLEKLEGGKAVVVGHSNTLLPLLAQFPVEPSKTAIADADYENIFVVKVERRLLLPSRFTLREATFAELKP
jgi:broad specificity phosphatase PhoE